MHPELRAKPAFTSATESVWPCLRGRPRLYDHLDDGAFDDLDAVEAQEPLSVVRDHGFGEQREHELNSVALDSRPDALQDHKERHHEGQGKSLLVNGVHVRLD